MLALGCILSCTDGVDRLLVEVGGDVIVLVLGLQSYSSEVLWLVTIW